MSHEIIENSNAVAILPPELLVEIFSYFSEEQLATIKQVCRHWQDNINTHFSLHGKFLSMQRWHNIEIDNTIKELEKFKDSYTTIGYRNIYFRGNFETKFSLYLVTFLSIVMAALCMGTLYYILKEHSKRPLWAQMQYANKMQEVKWGLIGLTVFIILSSIGGFAVVTRRERDAHQTIQITTAILDKLKAFYMSKRFFFDELQDAALKGIFFPPQGAIHALPTNQYLNQKISDDCTKLPKLKEEIASYANTLVKQTAVNRDKVSSYCLKAISLWNETHPKRQIPISERIVFSNISERKYKSAPKTVRTL